MPTRRLGTLTAVAVTVLCIALFGVAHGAVVACVVAPVLAALATRSAGPSCPPGALTGLPFALDLGAAVLRGGAPVSVALEQAAPAAGGPLANSLSQIARLLRLGAAPVEAWRTVPDDARLASLAAVSLRSATSGIRLAGAWEQLAGELRAERRAQALAKAHRAGVFAMAPLGLCFLPAFVCLGVIPDVLGVVRGALG